MAAMARPSIREGAELVGVMRALVAGLPQVTARQVLDAAMFLTKEHATRAPETARPWILKGFEWWA